MSSLDPADWEAFRKQSHRMLDDAIDFISRVAQRPVWQPVPDEIKNAFAAPMPQEGRTLEAVHESFLHEILPYATGNIHPRFFGYVHGSGTPSGMLAEMLAATMNANLGGREHGAIYVERQVICWFADLFGFPRDASGLLVTGTSLANMIALLVARRAQLGPSIRTDGIDPARARLVAYASAASHGCISKALDMMGIGSAALRKIAVDTEYRMNVRALREAIAEDRAHGLTPFVVVGTAGTVDVGAIDDFAAIADVAEAEDVWFHVDGAFGALVALSEELRPLVAGIERADSIGFDFHKWLHVPYDAGCVLVRDSALHRDTFSASEPYLARLHRGLAGGEPWFCDYGPDLSRGFRALKVWFTVQQYGARALGDAVARNCAQAKHLADLVDAQPSLERLAPVPLNIVCFRYVVRSLDRAETNALNAQIVAELQESGVAAPSTTMIEGKLAIRVNLTNHRTQDTDLVLLVREIMNAPAVRKYSQEDALQLPPNA